MKRLLLDFLRRRWWFLVPLLAVNFCLLHFLGVARGSVLTLLYTIPLLLGPFLLSFDSRQLSARTLLSLPLTARQVGRSCWVAAVGLPALALLLCGLVSDMAKGIQDHGFLSLRESLLQALWVGSCFFFLTGLRSGPVAGRWEWVQKLSFSLGWWVFFAGGTMLFGRFSWNNPVQVTVLLTLGSLFSVAGWFRAESLVRPGHAPQPAAPPLAIPPLPKPGRRTFRAPVGFGGMPFLLRMLLFPMVRAVAIFVFGIPLILIIQGTKMDLRFFLETIPGQLASYFLMFSLFLLVLPVVNHLRMLRSLPISASRLAALLVFLPAGFILICCFAFLAVKAAVLGGASISTLPVFAFAFAFALAGLCALCVPVLVWQGGLGGSYGIIMLPVAMLPLLGIFTKKILLPPSPVIELVTCGLIIGSWFLTRHLLQTGRRTYRPPAITLPGWAGRRA